jgi:hypothetical protein
MNKRINTDEPPLSAKINLIRQNIAEIKLMADGQMSNCSWEFGTRLTACRRAVDKIASVLARSAEMEEEDVNRFLLLSMDVKHTLGEFLRREGERVVRDTLKVESAD